MTFPPTNNKSVKLFACRRVIELFDEAVEKVEKAE